jgi:lysophospholipase L1-like esterase
MVRQERETAQTEDSPGPGALSWQGIILRLGLALFGLAAAVTVLELGLRGALGPQLNFHLSYWKYHPLLGHTHPLNLVVDIPFPEHPAGEFRVATNNHGLREDEDTSYEKPPGVFRILALGDSHTDGTANNAETYPNVLESALVSQGLQAEVLNAGVGSYSPFTELLWFHFYGRQYQPEVIVVGLYVGNDLNQMKAFERITIANDGTVFVDGTPLQPRRRPVGEWVGDQVGRSYLYSVASGLLGGLRPETDIPVREQASHACRGCFWQSLDQAYSFHSGDLSADKARNRLDNILTEFQKQADAAGARLIIMLIPTKRQVEGPSADAERFARAADMLGLSAEEREFDSLALETVLDACERAQVEALNLLPSLQEVFANTGEPLYYVTDWHLNPAGHRAVASMLEEIVP